MYLIAAQLATAANYMFSMTVYSLYNFFMVSQLNVATKMPIHITFVNFTASPATIWPAFARRSNVYELCKDVKSVT